MFILLEAIGCWVVVMNKKQDMFMAIVDTACAITYPLIILKVSAFKNTTS